MELFAILHLFGSETGFGNNSSIIIQLPNSGVWNIILYTESDYKYI